MSDRARLQDGKARVLDAYARRPRLKVLICLLFVATFSAHGALALEVALRPSRESIEKGSRVQLYLRMATAEQAVGNLEVRPLLPNGFEITGSAPPAPSYLAPESEILLQYTVEAPKLIGSSGVSTREPKEFAFSYSYTVLGREAEPTRGVAETTVRYTTSIIIFVGSGIAGLFLAHLIKSLAKFRTEPRTEVGFCRLCRFVFCRQLAELFTTLLIGFAVLMVLARDGVPAQGWYDSLALGITLGILGDENLLGKLRGS